MAQAINKFRTGYERFLEYLVILLMAALALEVTVGVVFRTIGMALVWYDEVASVLLAWLTFYGSALAAVKRAHIGCPGPVAAMPPVWRLAFTVIAEICVFAFLILLAYVGWMVLDVLSTDYLVTLSKVPVSFTQSVIPISAVLFIIAEALNLPEILKQARHGSGPGAHAQSAKAEVSH